MCGYADGLNHFPHLLPSKKKQKQNITFLCMRVRIWVWILCVCVDLYVCMDVCVWGWMQSAYISSVSQGSITYWLVNTFAAFHHPSKRWDLVSNVHVHGTCSQGCPLEGVGVFSGYLPTVSVPLPLPCEISHNSESAFLLNQTNFVFFHGFRFFKIEVCLLFMDT